MNKSDAIYERKQLIADFIGCECFGIVEEATMADYDESIDLINIMIEHSIAIGNKENTAEWRRMLQQTKVEKRRVREMIDNKNRMESVLS